MRGVRAVAVGAICLSAALALATPPGPGQPFDDDDPGCVPDTTLHRKCSEKVARAFGRLISGVTGCHDKQALAAFAASSFDEEACEVKAQVRFEATRDAIAPACSPTQLTLASDEETELLDPTSPGSLDARNGNVFCDSTSGSAIDSGGDDTGWVPATTDALWCARSVAKNVAKLSQAVIGCHAKMADLFSIGRDFDEEACEEFDPLTGRGARDRYSARVAKLIAHGGCPPCLDAAHQEGLALGTVMQIDADNGRLYPCP